MKKTQHPHSTALVILFVLLLATLSFSIKEGYQTFVLNYRVQYLQAHIGVLHHQAALNDQNMQLLLKALEASETKGEE